MATEAYTYARMLHAAAVQPGSRIAVSGGVGYARAQSRARRCATHSSPGSSPAWTAALPGLTPSSASSSSLFLRCTPDFVLAVVVLPAGGEQTPARYSVCLPHGQSQGTLDPDGGTVYLRDNGCGGRLEARGGGFDPRSLRR